MLSRLRAPRRASLRACTASLRSRDVMPAIGRSPMGRAPAMRLVRFERRPICFESRLCSFRSCLARVRVRVRVRVWVRARGQC